MHRVAATHPELIVELQAREKVVHAKYSDFIAVSNKLNITVEQYQWAVSMVLSRSFDDDGVRYVLPGVDFLNHCNHGNVEDQEQEQASAQVNHPLNVDIVLNPTQNILIVSTTRKHKAHEELCINYSKKNKLSRKNAILQYGMVVESMDEHE